MFNYKPYIVSLSEYMLENGYTIKPLPKIRLKKDKQEGLFIMTGYYNPNDKEVVLFITDIIIAPEIDANDRQYATDCPVTLT